MDIKKLKRLARDFKF